MTCPPPKKMKEYVFNVLNLGLSFCEECKMVSDSLGLSHTKKGRSVIWLFLFLCLFSLILNGRVTFWWREYGKSGTEPAFHPASKPSGSFGFLSWKPWASGKKPTCWRDKWKGGSLRPHGGRGSPASQLKPAFYPTLPTHQTCEEPGISQPVDPPGGCRFSGHHVE